MAVGLAQARAGHEEAGGADARQRARADARISRSSTARSVRSGSTSAQARNDRVVLSKALEALERVGVESRRDERGPDAVRPRAAAGRPARRRRARAPAGDRALSGRARSAFLLVRDGRRAAEPSRRRAAGAHRVRRAGRRRRRTSWRAPTRIAALVAAAGRRAHGRRVAASARSPDGPERRARCSRRWPMRSCGPAIEPPRRRRSRAGSRRIRRTARCSRSPARSAGSGLKAQGSERLVEPER